MEGVSFTSIIIGAGPNGLAALSRLREPGESAEWRVRGHDFSGRLSCSSNCGRVAVIDPSGGWMHRWEEHFAELDINHLRSPMNAHPDFRDPDALMTYAHDISGRWCEADVNINGRSEDINFALGRAHVSDFLQFSRKLASELSHDFFAATATDVRWRNDKKALEVELSNGKVLQTLSVILALGYGKPFIPPQWRKVPGVYHASQVPQIKLSAQKRVLVIGGGSSAAQCSLRAAKYGCDVVMCSKRELRVQPFDLPVDWIDTRTAGQRRFQFYQLENPKDRLRFVKSERIASISSEDYERLRACDRILHRVAAVRSIRPTRDQGLSVRFAGEEKAERFDLVVCATGFANDIANSDPLVSKIMERFPISTTGGVPILADNLKWRKDVSIFCLGPLACLSEGPEVFSMMGTRRCVSLIGSQILPRSTARLHASTFDVLETDLQ